MSNTQDFNHMTPGQWLLRLVQGALTGVGAILPGVSGGVLCVLFGIYQPMMALLAHPFKSFKQYYKLFIPVIIGAAIGFLGLAKVVALVFAASETLAVCLFVGLIIGMFPSLFREAGEKGRTNTSWAVFAASFVVFFLLLSQLQGNTVAAITPNWGWYLFCGVVWGLSLVVPGLSSSSILIFMGLYQPMTDGIGRFDLGVLIPLFIGILGSALLLARLVNHLFEKHYSNCYHFILGVVVASSLLIIPRQFADTNQMIYGILLGIGGFIAAWAMDVWGQRVKAKNNIQS